MYPNMTETNGKSEMISEVQVPIPLISITISNHEDIEGPLTIPKYEIRFNMGDTLFYKL